MTVTAELALGEMTQIEMVLSVLHRPWWLGQIQSHAVVTGIIPTNVANVN